MGTTLVEQDILEARAAPFQRKVVFLPNRSAVTLWCDKDRAIRLTVTPMSFTVEKAVLEGGRVGSENGP
jgi:hypothetical protein